MPASRASSCDKATKLAPVSTSMRTRLPSSVGWTTKWPRKSAETTMRLPFSAPAADSAFSLGAKAEERRNLLARRGGGEHGRNEDSRGPDDRSCHEDGSQACAGIVVRPGEQAFKRGLAGPRFRAGWFPNSFRRASNAVMRQDAREARDQRRLGRNGVDRDTVAGERAGEQRDPSPVPDGGDALRLREERKSAVDLVAGEKPRDIRPQLLARQLPGHGSGAGAEDEMQEPNPPPG